MKNKFLKGLVASFALAISGFASAGLIVVDTESPVGGGASYTWTHYFDTHSSSILDATIEITHSYLGYLGPGPEGAAALYVDGVFLDYFTDGDSCDGAASDCSLYSGTYTDLFTLSDFTSLADGDVTFTIQAHSWDGWYLGVSGGVDEASTLTVTYAEVPEPSTLAIFALGLMGLASRKLKKQA